MSHRQTHDERRWQAADKILEDEIHESYARLADWSLENQISSAEAKSDQETRGEPCDSLLCKKGTILTAY
jgi:hypothetical protein